MENKNEILKFTNDLCQEHDCKLLYLTFFGSHLYGTNTEESDLDVKGIFLPSKVSVLLGRATKHISRKEPYDIELISIHEWLKNLRKGETIAMDILFSPTSKTCPIYVDERVIPLFEVEAYNHLIDWAKLENSPYIRYAYGQAIKYGIKGERYNIIECVLDITKKIYYEEARTDWLKYNIKLEGWIDDIVTYCGNEKYCHKVVQNGVDSLYLCGKIHLGSISLREFKGRVSNIFGEYGNRTKLAANSNGKDWKALSHALRAVYQIIELAEIGCVRFPLRQWPVLLAVKTGKLSFDEVSNLINAGFEHFNRAYKNSRIEYKWNQSVVDKFILYLYKEGL